MYIRPVGTERQSSGSPWKAAFNAAAEAVHKPAAVLPRRFMRSFVEQRQRSAFEAEARRHSLAIAARVRDPRSDEHATMRELNADWIVTRSRLIGKREARRSGDRRDQW